MIKFLKKVAKWYFNQTAKNYAWRTTGNVWMGE